MTEQRTNSTSTLGSPTPLVERTAPWSAQKRYAEVLGRRMAYIERGSGQAILFLHGNPTSSFLWRNILPHVEQAGRRLLAPDLIGMGDSDKIPQGTEADRYRFVGHARYLEALIQKLVGQERIVLVLHDWGGALGFDWAARHSDRVLGIAYMETFLRPLSLADLPESFHPTLKAVRSPEGERLVLEENMFIEQMLPGVTQRPFDEYAMSEYRRPFVQVGEDRAATLQWPREVPLSGEPADVAARMTSYSTWLKQSPVPKLFIDAEPGVFVTGEVRELAFSLSNQTVTTVKGLHFVQEDCPHEVGLALHHWLQQLIPNR